MFALKLTVSVIIVAAVLYGLYRVQRGLRMQSHGMVEGGLVSRGIRKVRRDSPHDIERFVAEYHANAARAAVDPETIDPVAEPRLGTDIPKPKLRKVAEGPHQLLYLLLKTALPDYYVFPNARLDDFILGLPAQLGSGRVDFLLCDRSFAAQVALDITQESVAVQRQEVRQKLLSDLGVRQVTLSLNPLPRRQDIRSLLFGEHSD